MNIQFYQKLTLLDYPGYTAATVFTHGCNFRCPFCHNASLVVRKPEDNVDEDELFSFLKKRKGLLDGVCITGGEPLLQKDITDFIKKVKDIGYMVKVDTNGSFPEKLREIIDDNLADYVAMDIKSSRDGYKLVCGTDDIEIEKIEKSVEILKNSSIDYEFRTTAVKGLHTINDFNDIALWIEGDSKYFIQSYKNSGDIISHTPDTLSSFTEKELEMLKNAIISHVPNTTIRGI